jgi:hypothetical protein
LIRYPRRRVVALIALVVFAQLGVIAAGFGFASAEAPASHGLQVDAGKLTALTAAGALSAVTYPSSTPGGVQVLNGVLYAVDNTQLIRVDTGSGATTLIAGAANTATCVNSGTGSNVRFTAQLNGGMKLAGTAGTYLYVLDGCGVRRVNPLTGATTTIDTTRYRQGAVSGTTFYGASGALIYKIDLSNLGRPTSWVGLPTINGSVPTITVDSTTLWAIDAYGYNLYSVDLATRAITTATSNLAQASGQPVMISVGDWLYTAFRSAVAPNYNNTLVRINKYTHVPALVPLTGVAVSHIAGIATDGTSLFVEDYSTTASSIKTVTPTTETPFLATATSPEMGAGLVSTIVSSGLATAASPQSTFGGIAFIGSTMYAADGTRIVRVDQSTSTVTAVAGVLTSTSCVDAPEGASARFDPRYGTGITLVGADGTYLYVTDQCGLRRIEPGTGATSTIDTRVYAGATISGHMLYGDDLFGTFYKYDLATMTQPVLFRQPLIANGNTGNTYTLAADDDMLWALALGGSVLYAIYPATGDAVRITDNLLPSDQPASAMLSVGGHLYAAVRSSTNKSSYTKIISIEKATGAGTIVAGSDASGYVDGGYTNAGFTSIAGIATDGTALYVSDISNTQTRLRKVQNPATVFDNTVVEPDNNPIVENVAAGYDVPGLSNDVHVIVYDHTTWKCSTNCQILQDYAQMVYAEGGGYNWWHYTGCMVSGCTPSEVERDTLEKIVETQGIYDWTTGFLRADYTSDKVLAACYEYAAQSSTDCGLSDIKNTAHGIQKYSDLAQDVVAFLANRPRGLRPELNDEQLAAKSKYESLAKQACADVARLVTETGEVESAQKWGWRVHKRFEQLVAEAQQTNPKLMGETGYLGRKLAAKNGSANPPNSSFPDAVYGSSWDTPEMLFDLKTGLKLIQEPWVTKLATNLPAGLENIPVFNLTCG